MTEPPRLKGVRGSEPSTASPAKSLKAAQRSTDVSRCPSVFLLLTIASPDIFSGDVSKKFRHENNSYTLWA